MINSTNIHYFAPSILLLPPPKFSLYIYSPKHSANSPEIMNISEQSFFNKTTATTTTTTCLFFLLISFSTTTIIFSSGDREATSVFPFIFASAVVVAGFVVLAVRTTVVAWITVVVLLAFVGKRRRIFAKDGKKITSEVVVYVVNEVIKEKGFVAISGVMILGLIATALL
ncbi:hypothetical protein AABB24_006145 [Solanum stoloniferum]|uniref:Uncharacterized protein n=1 Tax=Solanum stoloniferum TaxID=62892 RepID=A0ABD2V1E7_9SOLN